MNFYISNSSEISTAWRTEGADDQKEVEDEERGQEEITSPPILVSDIQWDEEVLSNSSGRPRSGDIVRVIEISAKRRHKLVRPRPTRLTLWWIEPGELVRFTLDLRPVELGADHRAHSASERIEVIQLHSRPLSDLGAGDRDTTGSRKDGRQERVEQDGDLNGRRNGADELDKEDDEENAIASARG